MPRWFNITGPCNPDMHYMVPPEARLPNLRPYLAQHLYFIVHAPRQTGKTTAMRVLATRLRSEGAVALHVTLETAFGFEEVAPSEALWITAVQRSGATLPPEWRPPAEVPAAAPGARFQALLQAWSEAVAPVPIVLLLDEADCITGEAVINFLRQLRSGFPERPGHFPASIALIGLRDLRDYITRAKGAPVTAMSPFNINAGSFTLGNFTVAQVESLYAQHTAETGQVITADAVERVYYWTQGQPLLVNLLAWQCVMDDPVAPIDGPRIESTRQQLVVRRVTHLDNLAERMKEERVAQILVPILAGDDRRPVDTTTDDFQYAVDLGLVRRGPSGAEVACPWYREVLARQLTVSQQEHLPEPWWRWRSADGGLDIAALMAAFQVWWRRHGDVVGGEHGPYRELTPHLTLMAFLQRVVNGGGTVERKYAAGRGRIDLLVEYGGHRYCIELKRIVPWDPPEVTIEEGLEQLRGYLDVIGLGEGWLVLFDVRPGRTWDERIWSRSEIREGKALHLVGG